MEELRVDLEAFQGPLDLLLHLVQQEEVAVEDLPLARVADRFLDLVRSQIQSLDVDQAGEFLVMASQLLVLKSRALLPRETSLDVEEIDPRLDLVRQLLEYREFKEAAQALGARAEAEEARHPARAKGPRSEPPSEDQPIEADLFALVSAFQRLMRETGDEHAVAMPKERLPITHFVGLIFDQLHAVGGSVGFRELIGARPDKTYVIGAFLALLELIKLRKVRVVQTGLEDLRIEVQEGAVPPGAEDEGTAIAEALDRPEVEEEGQGGPRIVFMGSPAFAVPALRSLVGAGYRPRLVVTPPPRRAGRGRRATPVPVAKEAEALELPLHRTNDVNGRASRSEIEAIRPALVVTVGFGQKLGPALLSLPAHGCLNLHASLLPRYRGASPIAAAIRDGATATGVSVFVMDEELDHGPVLATREVEIRAEDTADDLAARLAEEGADLLVRTIGAYFEGAIQPQPQDHEQATYVGRLTKQDGVIDWDRPAEAVHDQVRAVTSWPGAQTAWQPKVRHEPLPVVVLATEVRSGTEAAPPPSEPVDTLSPAEGNGSETQETAPPASSPAMAVRPGTVVAAGAAGIDVACAEGTLRILRLKPAGGRPMASKDFLNARRVVSGDRFVAPEA